MTCAVDQNFYGQPVTTSVPFGTITQTIGIRGTTTATAQAYFDNVLAMTEK